MLGWDLEHWLGHVRDAAPETFAAAFDPLIARRAQREPVAYIVGEREFYWRRFIVTPATLIPRPETELLIDTALQASAQHRFPRVIDVGTGSGCIAVTIAAELAAASVTATDISEPALEIARANAAQHGVAERIDFRRGAYFAGAAEPFDLILSNPPYVPERDRAGMQPDVVNFEPATALFAGGDGLDCVRSLIALSTSALAPGGSLIFEFGFGQAPRIKQLIACQPDLRLESLLSDLQDIPRIAVVARR